MANRPIWDRLNVEALLTQFVSWLPSLFAALLIVLFFWACFRITRPALRRVLERTGLEEALVSMLLNVYRFVLLAFGLVMAASQLGINVGAALAGLGVAGLTIGFAAKDSLSNIMAGFLIFWDKPFHVGDWISVSDHIGKVAQITMRTTRLQTRNNTWVIIPNEKMLNEVLVNHSANGRTRIQVPVGIGYSDSIDKARAALVEAIKQIDYFLPEPPPSVVVSDMGSSSVNLIVFAWIADAKDEQPANFALAETVKLALDQAGIEMPFTQMDVSLRSVRKQAADEVASLMQSSTSPQIR